MKTYKSKVITTNKRIIVRNYGRGILYDYARHERKVFEGGSGAISEGEKDRSTFSITRTRETIMNLIDMNVNEYSKFGTLTFASKPRNRNEVVNAFRDFSLRYKIRYGEKLRYIYVTEKATNEGEYKNKEGKTRRYTKRWHIHAVIFNARFITLTDMRDLWRYGSARINAIDSSENIGLYLMKYITKSAIHFNKKGFVSSLGLSKPGVTYSNDPIPIDPKECIYNIEYLSPLYNKNKQVIGHQVVNQHEIILIN